MSGKVHQESERKPWQFILLFGVALLWAGLVNMAIYRSLNVRIWSVEGQPTGLLIEFLIYLLGGTPGVLVAWLAFFLLCGTTRWRLQWLRLCVSITLLGTPLTFVVGRYLALWLWERNEGGVPWEEELPVAFGFFIACVVGGLAVRGRQETTRDVR